MAVKITVEDGEGPPETATIENDYVLICAGRVYLDGIQQYPSKGTTVLTIKTRPQDSSSEPSPQTEPRSQE